MGLLILSCNHIPIVPIVIDGKLNHWLCACGNKHITSASLQMGSMKNIYWFVDNGLFTGSPHEINCTSVEQVEHKCDAMISDYKIVKNRYGGHCSITPRAIKDLFAMPLSSQLAFFKSI